MKRPTLSGRPAADFDLAILGGGSAGYAAARVAAAAGLKTVVIEGGPEVGGLCILRGCMPSKTLLYSAEVLHLARNAGKFGIDIKGASANLRSIHARKSRIISEFASHRVKQLESGGFDLLRSNARF